MIRQRRLRGILPTAALVIGIGIGCASSLIILSHGLPPWRTAWFPPSSARYAVCFSVRAGIDPVSIAEGIAGPHPYVTELPAADGYGRKWHCTPIATSTADGVKALSEAESVLGQVRGDGRVAESYLHAFGGSDMLGQ